MKSSEYLNDAETASSRPKYVDPDYSEASYFVWHKEKTGEEMDASFTTWYNTNSEKICNSENSQGFFSKIKESLREWGAQYSQKNGYDLLARDDVKLETKSFESLKEKIYRKNFKKFQEEKSEGLATQTNLFEKINDTVRGLIVVKYLDAVDFLAIKISELAKERGVTCELVKEARGEGYFAIHLYYMVEYEVAGRDWNPIKVKCSIEVQIATQLQDVIRKLTHKQYEINRLIFSKKAKDPWQWRYTEDEFFLNGLGHTIHYLEGMILEIRDNKCKGTTR